MSKTIVEKIISAHSNQPVSPGAIVDVAIDVRVARDFGGANVVKNLLKFQLAIDEPAKTFFTFDCNPGGSEQKYAQNQQICRQFARENSIQVFDIQNGIGTHLVIEKGLVIPGSTFVSTDSHANILGAIGAFGQGMGDQDIAAVWSHGRVWFEVPPTSKIIFKGTPGPYATAKDIALALLQVTGAHGLLGYASEFFGSLVSQLSLDARITIASMNTEMGGIIALFEPNQAILDYFSAIRGESIKAIAADANANYEQAIEVDLDQLEPQISRPGHPEDVVPAKAVGGKKIDSAFIGSCTNGRLSDLEAAASILKGRKVAPGVVLKIVPATNQVWNDCLNNGLISIFKQAGALVGSPGCAGCANGQIGQNGPGEITISTGNRNFIGKQGLGEVYLASPQTVAASAIAGHICTVDRIPSIPTLFPTGSYPPFKKRKSEITSELPRTKRPTLIFGRIWIIRHDNIDTDMIFHNRYLTVTDISRMGQYTFDNLKGWTDFAQRVRAGDIVITGKNFGAGSSRQQAVDCFKSLGIALIIAQSFGAIYERNAINGGLAVMNADLLNTDLETGQEIEVNLEQGTIYRKDDKKVYSGQPFSKVQMEIYQRGGLLN